MRKLGLSLIAMLCIAFLASNAFAAEELHKKGDNSVGIGYSSLTPSGIPVTLTMSGININWTYYYTDNIAAAIKADFLSGSIGTISTTLSPLIIQIEWHSAFMNSFGYYLGLGYASTPGSVNNISTRDTGITYEGGLEYKFMNNIIGNIGYQYVGLIGGSISGISGGVNYLF